MRLRALAALAGCAAVALTAGLASAAPRPFPHFQQPGCARADFPSGGGTVRAELCRASGTAPAPAVVVLHGCGGFDTLDHDLAADLPASGITTLYVDYFGLTPPPDGRGFCDAFGHAGDDFPIWQRIVVDAAAALKRQPSVDPKRVGVVGWSLGGAVALAAAEFGSTPAGTAPAHGGPFRAVVLYSSAGFGPLLDGAHVLPPTLILSGGSTDAIPLSAVLPLHQALVAAHVPSELFVYPHGSHSWPGPQGAAGLRHTVAFLRRYLASAR